MERVPDEATPFSTSKRAHLARVDKALAQTEGHDHERGQAHGLVRVLSQREDLLDERLHDRDAATVIAGVKKRKMW